MRLNLIVFYFLALLFAACGGEAPTGNQKKTEDMPKLSVDWQGHRGARGLLPENTVPAFLLALEYPKVTTLELDLAVSKDGQLIVSHEPWLSHHICSWPDGRPVLESETEALTIYQLTAAEVRTYDCGSRGNERFPKQKAMKTYKPLLSEVVAAADQRATELGRALPKYNIEIKSQPKWDNVKAPPPVEFAQLLLAELNRLGIKERSCIQSFDPRAMEAVHQQDPDMTTAFLVEELGSLDDLLEQLSFVPTIYSPYYILVTANMVQQIHNREMKLIPWTVNETENMEALLKLGVDGIITDYPDRIP